MNVQSADGLVNVTLTPNMAVTDQALSATGTISPPALTLTPSLSQAVLYHFIDPNANLGPADFQAAVTWGDGKSNASGDGSGSVQVVADPAGGFDVLGTHTYGAAVKGALYAVYVADSAGLVLVNPVLYHFTDANPLAKAADFTATVGWGDGSTDTSGITNFDVFVVANPSGGFDVVGAHAYTKYLRAGTLQVMVPLLSISLARRVLAGQEFTTRTRTPVDAGPATYFSRNGRYFVTKGSAPSTTTRRWPPRKGRVCSSSWTADQTALSPGWVE